MFRHQININFKCYYQRCISGYYVHYYSLKYSKLIKINVRAAIYRQIARHCNFIKQFYAFDYLLPCSRDGVIHSIKIFTVYTLLIFFYILWWIFTYRFPPNHLPIIFSKYSKASWLLYIYLHLITLFQYMYCHLSLNNLT